MQIPKKYDIIKTREEFRAQKRNFQPGRDRVVPPVFTGRRERRLPSLEESYAAFCAGEAQAFDAVMRELQQPLTAFLQGYVHSCESAEDLAEETFVELLVHKGRFRGQSSLKTYVFSVARHKAIDHIRREQRRSSVPIDEIGERASEEPGPEEQIAARERTEAIAHAIGALPGEYREVLRLLYIERLRYDEIADVMKKGKKQVDNLAYRARGALRFALGREANFIEEL